MVAMALVPECRNNDIVFNVGRKKATFSICVLVLNASSLIKKIKFFRCGSLNFNKINIRLYTRN